MVLIFTGNGKGKTTAALGQALRAVGDGKKVLMVQFIKGPWKSGEDEAYKFLPGFKLEKCGKGFVGILGDKLPLEVHIEAAEEGLSYARSEVQTGRWNVLILDEIWNALSLKLLDREKIMNFIGTTSHLLDYLILTGRDCPQEFVDMADLVTEMKEIKHPFNSGKMGQKGLEY